MRIKKDRPTNLGIIGKIKIGEKNEKGFPTSLDYFKATSNVQTYVDIFNNIYEKQSTLPICFSCDDDAFNTNHRYEIRTHQGKLYAFGDGHDFHVSMAEGYTLFENKTLEQKYGGVKIFMQKTQEHLSTQKYKPVWKEILTLRFIIAKIPVLGVWELRTSASRSSIDQILSSYDMIKNVNGGSVVRVPFFLNVQKVKSARALQQARVYPVISLNPLLPELANGNIFDAELLEETRIKLLDK